MGQIASTYSYTSPGDALKKMLSQLDELGVTVCYSEIRNQYFYIKKPKHRRYVRVRKTRDIWGNIYYECYID